MLVFIGEMCGFSVWGNKRSRLTELVECRALEIPQHNAPQRALLLIRTFRSGSIRNRPRSQISRFRSEMAFAKPSPPGLYEQYIQGLRELSIRYVDRTSPFGGCRYRYSPISCENIEDSY